MIKIEDRKKFVTDIGKLMLETFPNMRDSSRANLEKSVADEDFTYYASAISVDFDADPNSSRSMFGTCGLTVRFDETDYFDDEETGDTWRSFKVKFNMVWSSCNRAVTSDVVKEATLLHSVACEAVRLQSLYSETYAMLVSTKQQKEERAAKLAAEQLLERVKKLTLPLVKGMRANGNPRDLLVEYYKDVPRGSYEFSYANGYDTKTYVVRVQESFVRVRRTA